MSPVEKLSLNMQNRDWSEVKDDHFIVKYLRSTDRAWAQRVLREAERGYDTVGRQIGFKRYHNFWTWDNRAQIYIYPSRETFMEDGGHPAWSLGGVVIDNQGAFGSRTILSFRQEENFLKGTLLHEISHLIIRDYLGAKTYIPLWFDEGVAQWQAASKKDESIRIMKKLIRKGVHIPFDGFFRINVMSLSRMEEAERVGIFYMQAVSMVDFLLKAYGQHDFRELCSYLRDGKTFEEALKGAYTSRMETISEFEKKWLRYMQN